MINMVNRYYIHFYIESNCKQTDISAANTVLEESHQVDENDTDFSEQDLEQIERMMYAVNENLIAASKYKGQNGDKSY